VILGYDNQQLKSLIEEILDPRPEAMRCEDVLLVNRNSRFTDTKSELLSSCISRSTVQGVTEENSGMNRRLKPSVLARCPTVDRLGVEFPNERELVSYFME